MKKLSLIFLLFATPFLANAQSRSFDHQAMQMLKTFYIDYNTLWSTAKGYNLVKKLDSMQRKYCTITARRELKKLSGGEGIDHDYLINDQGTDIAHAKKLTVAKDTTKPNAYIVSYIAPTRDPAYKPIDLKVVIRVMVAEENGVFKIAYTYGNQSSMRD